jgi:hypothetical protein
MTNSIKLPKVFYVSRDGRDYFFKDILPDWVVGDENYKVVELAPKPVEIKLEEFVGPVQPTIQIPSQIPSMNVDEVKDQLKLMNDLFELEEKEIKLLKEQLTEFVEAVEAIHEFSSKKTENLMEAKGLLLLIAETCGNLLKARV